MTGEPNRVAIQLAVVKVLASTWPVGVVVGVRLADSGFKALTLTVISAESSLASHATSGFKSSGVGVACVTCVTCSGA